MATTKDSRFMLVTGGLVAAALLVGLGVMVANRSKKPALTPAPDPNDHGFVVLPSCSGITVTSDARAMEYAKQMGKLADPFGPQNAQTWLVEALGYMGIPTDCDVTKTPVTAAFIYRLFRSYLQGALGTRIMLAEANVQLSYFRTFLLASTPLLSGADLPEGVQ